LILAYVVANKENGSMAKIDGGRFEVHVTSPNGTERRADSSYKLFLLKADDITKNAVDEYLVWANKVATSLLPSLYPSNLPRELIPNIFEGHSFIVSLGDFNVSQTPHVDLRWPLVQFGFYLTDNTPPTRVDTSNPYPTITPEDAIKIWKINLNEDALNFIRTKDIFANFGANHSNFCFT